MKRKSRWAYHFYSILFIISLFFSLNTVYIHWYVFLILFQVMVLKCIIISGILIFKLIKRSPAVLYVLFNLLPAISNGNLTNQKPQTVPYNYLLLKMVFNRVILGKGYPVMGKFHIYVLHNENKNKHLLCKYWDCYYTPWHSPCAFSHINASFGFMVSLWWSLNSNSNEKNLL